MSTDFSATREQVPRQLTGDMQRQKHGHMYNMITSTKARARCTYTVHNDPSLNPTQKEIEVKPFRRSSLSDLSSNIQPAG
jgi:hypothetical protein